MAQGVTQLPAPGTPGKAPPMAGALSLSTLHPPYTLHSVLPQFRWTALCNGPTLLCSESIHVLY